MEEQVKDSLFTVSGGLIDSAPVQRPFLIETRPIRSHEFQENLYSNNLTKDNVPDWYFITLIITLSGIAAARMIYGKFLNSIFISAFSYQAASKVYKEQSLVQRRFGLFMDLLYFINGALFLYLIFRFFTPELIGTNEVVFVLLALLILFLLVILRVVVMRLTAFIFERDELFLGFLYHFFLFNKALGMILIPFLVAIPYTQGKLQEYLIYTGFSIVILIHIIRLIRAGIYVFKNVVLIFYLILYLCILEILPLLVVFKLLLSLAQV
jgi:hypothetical protein